MGWNTDFEVSTTVLMAIFEVEPNVSEFYDLNCKPDGGSTGITGIATFGHVPVGGCWIWLNVADDARLYNATGKQITVTGVLNVVAEASGIAGSIQLPECFGWAVFNRTDSTAYQDTGQVTVSWTWSISDMPHCSGLGIVFTDYGPRYYGDLDRVAGNVCICVSHAEVSCCQPNCRKMYLWHQTAWLRSPWVCCASQAAGRIAKKGRRS